MYEVFLGILKTVDCSATKKSVDEELKKKNLAVTFF